MCGLKNIVNTVTLLTRIHRECGTILESAYECVTTTQIVSLVCFVAIAQVMDKDSVFRARTRTTISTLIIPAAHVRPTVTARAVRHLQSRRTARRPSTTLPSENAPPAMTASATMFSVARAVRRSVQTCSPRTPRSTTSNQPISEATRNHFRYRPYHPTAGTTRSRTITESCTSAIAARLAKKLNSGAMGFVSPTRGSTAATRKRAPSRR